MDIFVKFCIGTAVILTAVFLVYIILKLKAYIETQLLLSSKEKSGDLIYKLLAANFSKSHIMKQPIFPFSDDPASKLFRVDYLIVNRGGILLITIRDLHGTIENPFRGDWRQFYNSNITQMKNPLDINAMLSNSVNNIFKREHVDNIPVKTILTYYDSNTKFKNKIEQIVCVSKLISYVKDMDKNHFLTISEILKTIKILSQNRRSIKRGNTGNGNTGTRNF